MTNILDFVPGDVAWAAVGLLAAIVLWILVRSAHMVRYIGNDEVGIVEKLWSRRGSVQSGLIALNAEAGYQPELLRGGIHFFRPFTYRVHRVPLVTIGQGQIGYVFARDGRPLEASQTLASNAEARDFQDARGFLQKGGQKGPQRAVLREGTYAINTAQFVVITAGGVIALSIGEERTQIDAMAEVIAARDGFTPVVIHGNEDLIGAVTVHDGPALPSGEIVAPEVGADAAQRETFHNNFQDADAFLAAGGYRGRQLQVLVDGTYIINRLFASIEPIDKTVVDVGYVGVVVSFTGRKGADVSGEQYRHGELVENGCRGVWRDPLLPGKYAFNKYAGNVILVPTTNFVLKWNRNAVSQHKMDENLSEISLITKDAFEPALPLSVVVHIDYKKAPQVIQRFGDIKRLIEQTLDPMVSAYFKDIGQRKTLIELLQERADIQRLAGDEMKAKFANYSLELQEVLIGTPRAQEKDATIETILAQLRDRQIAREQVETFKLKEEAAVQERSLTQAQATAAMQQKLTQSAVMIEVQQNEGAAALARATKDAEIVRIRADADAKQITAVGQAQAEATRAQVEAYGGAEYRLVEQIAERMFRAITEGKQALVPEVVVGGGAADAGNAGALVSGMVASLMPLIHQMKERPPAILPPSRAA
jgi:uncharacterized membrane protein YqiK